MNTIKNDRVSEDNLREHRTQAEKFDKVKHNDGKLFFPKVTAKHETMKHINEFSFFEFFNKLGQFVYENQNNLEKIESLKNGITVNYIHDNECLGEQEKFTFHISLDYVFKNESDLVIDNSDF